VGPVPACLAFTRPTSAPEGLEGMLSGWVVDGLGTRRYKEKRKRVNARTRYLEC
jgi:hypothetical protein